MFGNQLEKAIHNLNKTLLLLLFAVYIYVYSTIQKHSRIKHSARTVSMHSLCFSHPSAALNQEQFHTRNEAESDHRSYKQLLGRILQPNSLGKDYPGPPTSLQDFTHGKKHHL